MNDENPYLSPQESCAIEERKNAAKKGHWLHRIVVILQIVAILIVFLAPRKYISDNSVGIVILGGIVLSVVSLFFSIFKK
jgi:hypothetical protein